MNTELSPDMMRSMKDDRRLVLIGLGVAVVLPVLAYLVQLGQALGYRLNAGQLSLLFQGGVVAVVIGLLVILAGIGVFRPLRHLQWPFRSPFRPRLKPQDQATQILTSGHSFGGPAGGGPASVNWPLELNKRQVEIQGLQDELRQFGNDATARRLLKRAMDEFPKLEVGAVKDLAGLFYAAHVKPRSDDFKATFSQAEDQTRGYVFLGALKRTIELPYGEAMLVVNRINELIKDIQNDSINEAKRFQQ